MKQFILRIASFTALLLGIACAIEVFISFQMQGNRAHVHEDWADFPEISADVIFIGNSRTAGHLIPTRVSRGTDFSCYNIAYSGYTSKMGAFRLEHLLQHAKSPPHTVLLQCDLSFTARPLDNFPMKDGALRYFLRDPIGVNRFFRQYENWREADSYIPLLRYKGYPLIFLKHLLGWNRWDRKPQKGFWHSENNARFVPTNFPNIRGGRLHLSGIDSICKEHGIAVIGIIPPSPLGSNRPSAQALDSIRKTFPVWDFSELFAPDDSLYFYDQYHFDSEGAATYSDSVRNRLVRYYLTHAI
jgi:hypothetical protein